MILEPKTGRVFGKGADWFADWLETSYANRSDEPIEFSVREHIPVTSEVTFLNCVDTLYGHSLLKLLNAQRHIDNGESLIVMVPSVLEWMIPDGVAQAWVVNIDLAKGTQWNSWLAGEIGKRFASMGHVSLSPALSHPIPDSYAIERFTGVKPFSPGDWRKQGFNPTVTLIWRDDRTWPEAGRVSRVLRDAVGSDSQSSAFVALAERIRERLPNCDIAVAGIGSPGGLPSWMKDMRKRSVDAVIDREWCNRYASSHVVCGVHGSSMLLPSAHAGSVVELVGGDRIGNFLQDILFHGNDGRGQHFRYRFLPLKSGVSEVADHICSVAANYPDFMTLMNEVQR